MDVKVTVKLNQSAVEKKMKAASEKAVAIVTQQALKDCNKYCKQDQDGILNSSLIHSNFSKGEMRWKTPYVRIQYYLDATRKEKNPNARKMWAHHAASVHGNEWLKAMQKAFSKYAKEG